MEPGTPLWTARRFRAARASRYDAVIVGAGYTGLHAALLLARAGMSVCVLERGALTDAASARNAGFCTVSPPVPLPALLAQGEATARAWIAWFAGAVDCAEALSAELEKGARPGAAAIGFRRVGNLRLAETRRQAGALRRQAETFARLGAERAWLGPGRIDLPDEGRFSGALADSASAALNPGRLHVALAHAAEAAGADIFERRTALGIGSDGRVSTADGPIRARRILVATNGFTATTLAPFRKALLPVGSFLILTEPIPPAALTEGLAGGRCHATSFRFPHYFRLTPDHRLVFGGRAGLQLQTDLGACAAWLGARMQRLLPGLPATGVAGCWGGRLGFTADRRPLLGTLDGTVFYAMGCSGHGVPTSLAMARDAARAMLGAPNPVRAPFWRNQDHPPRPVSGPLRAALPLAQVGFRALDRVDLWRDALPTRTPSEAPA